MSYWNKADREAAGKLAQREAELYEGDEKEEPINMSDLKEEFIEGCKDIGGEVEKNPKFTKCEVDGGEVDLWGNDKFVLSSGFKVESFLNSPEKIELEEPPEGVSAPSTLRISDKHGNDISIGEQSQNKKFKAKQAGMYG